MLRFVIGTAMAVLSTFAALAAPVYKIEALPPGDEFVPTRAVAINDRGEVVGYGETLSGQRVVFKYAQGQVNRLAGDEDVTVSDINGAGDVLGQGPERNVIWREDGTREELNATGLAALNLHGVAAGWYWFSGNTKSHASLYKDGTLTDLGVWPGDNPLSDRLSIGNGLNDRGQVVGMAYLDNNLGAVAVVWENGAIRRVEGLPGEYVSEGIAINGKGHIVGSSGNFGWSDGFIHDGSTRALPRLKSKPFNPTALNNRDEVVGAIGQRAALSIRGKSYMLKSLLDASSDGWLALETAMDINDSGQIVGSGVYNFERRAFVATRVTKGE